jgi:Domain of unknown function (DUF4829)
MLLVGVGSFTVGDSNMSHAEGDYSKKKVVCMKIKGMLVLLISFLFLTSCLPNEEETSTHTVQETSNNPEEVIKTYFEGFEERDAEKIYSTLTDRYKKQHPISDFSFDNIKSKTLISLKDTTEEEGKQLAHSYAVQWGMKIKKENVKRYTVDFDLIFVDETKSAAPNGGFVYSFMLLREDEHSDWFIDMMGQ